MEKALSARMAHVDLNPIRAKLGETTEDSDYTSTQEWTRAFIHTHDGCVE